MRTSATTQGKILIVDDEEPIRTLLSKALQAQGFRTATAADAAEALRLLAGAGFDLVLSDVSMPGMNGIALLSEIRNRYESTGVVMLTGCEDISMAVEAMKTGALDYVSKPFHLDEVERVVREALDRRKARMREATHVRQLERAVEQQGVELRRILGHLQEASEATLEALVAALDAREHETHAHSKRVSEYALELAGRMNVDPPEREVIRRGAMLHDIGKIGISDTILLKPGSLTEAEWRQMRRHPQIGYWILNRIETLRPASEIVLAHHERYDGRGYPRGLRKTEIPLGARIFSVADALDAIMSERPYQRGKPYAEARREIVANAGAQFDPSVVDQFERVPPQVWEEIQRRTLAEIPSAPPAIAPLVLT